MEPVLAAHFIGNHDDGARMKPGHFYDEVYRQNYYFCIGWRIDDFNKYWKFADPHPLKDGYCCQLTEDRGSGIIIWVRKMPRPKMMGALSHEVVHAALQCLESRSFVLDYNNQEPLTYLVEAIMRKALS